ncbi:MAG: DUF3488 domain-containing protein [Deltaproteobacteria bacterium]|nr:DUF3488 domain-containing protein [Deltaproteobacteria bacterium]
MTTGTLHTRSLTATSVLAILGVVGGSLTLAVAGGAVLLAILFSAHRIDRIDRATFELWVVHGTTVVGVAFAALVFDTARVDSVFLILMLGLFNRFLLRTGHRDDFLVVGVSAVLMAGATTVTPGVEFALVVLLFVPALIWSLLTSMLLGSAERVGRATLEATRTRSMPDGLSMRIAVLGLTLGLLGSLAVAALPRYKFSSMFAPGAYAALSGAASTMQPDVDGVSDERNDDTVIARVAPADQRPLGPEALYLRLYSLDKFDGRGWSATPGGHFRFEQAARPNPLRTDVRLVMVTLDRLVRDQEHHPVAAIGLAGPSALVLPEPNAGLDMRSAFGIHESQAGGWVMDRTLGARMMYELALGQRSPAARRTEQFASKSRVNESEVPASLDPRIIELGRSLVSGAKTDQEKIQAVMTHLGRGFSYSLEPLEGESKDPLVRFLFESKRGHCELYASALAVLLRVAGLRTRVATGVYQGSWNSLGGHQSYSPRDAHAWVEVWVNDQWTWIDATPPDLRHDSRQGFLAQLRELYDAVSASWFDNVVDFDANRQRKLYETLSDRFAPSLLAFVPEIPSGVGTEGEPALRSTGAAFLLVPLFGALLWWTHLQRSSVKHLGRRLRRVLGGTDAPSETLGRLVARLPASEQPAATQAVEAYERLRFGGTGNRDEVASAIRRLDRQSSVDVSSGKAREAAAGKDV